MEIGTIIDDLLFLIIWFSVGVFFGLMIAALAKVASDDSRRRELMENMKGTDDDVKKSGRS